MNKYGTAEFMYRQMEAFFDDTDLSDGRAEGENQ